MQSAISARNGLYCSDLTHDQEYRGLVFATFGFQLFQCPSKHVAEGLWRPAAKALDVAGHNVERTRREARLDADDGVDDLLRQTRLRQSGAQLLFRNDKERKRPTSDFGDEGRALRTRQALGAGSVVGRACMAVADQDSGRSCRDVTACDESNTVLGEPGQHALGQRHLRLLREAFGIEVHAQDGPRRRRGYETLLAPPVGGSEHRPLGPARAGGRHEDDMLDARFHGRVDRSDVLRPALSGIEARNDEQPIETGIGFRKTFGLVVVSKPPLGRRSDGLGRARDRHYFVTAGPLQQFRNDGSAQMTTRATYTDFHVNLRYFSKDQRVLSFPATFVVISVGSFTNSRALSAFRRGKHRWHPAPVPPP